MHRRELDGLASALLEHETLDEPGTRRAPDQQVIPRAAPIPLDPARAAARRITVGALAREARHSPRPMEIVRHALLPILRADARCYAFLSAMVRMTTAARSALSVVSSSN